jgi:FkbM family methyltransferase
MALDRLMGIVPKRMVQLISRLQWQSETLRKAIDLATLPVRRIDMTIVGGVGRGLKFNAGGANIGYLFGTTEPELQRALQRVIRPGMTVYDIGASVGFHAVLASRLVGDDGLVCAFEPVPENVRLVEHNMALNGFQNYRCFDLALSDSDGRAEFNFSKSRILGSLAAVSRPNHFAESSLVETARLDTLVEQRGLKPPDVIKLDVEAAETIVLAGAANVLRSARPVCFIDLHGTNAPVADALDAVDYAHWVLTGPPGVSDVRAAPWWVGIVAAPRERERDVRAALA